MSYTEIVEKIRRQFEEKETKVSITTASLFKESKQEQRFWPRTALWNLLVDEEDRSSNNPLIYDQLRQVHSNRSIVYRKEPGYLKSVQTAFCFVEYTLSEPLSVEYIEFLHDTATNHLGSDRFGVRTEDRGTLFGINKAITTVDGIKETAAQYDDIVEAFYYTDDEPSTKMVIDKNSKYESIFNKLTVGYFDVIKMRPKWHASQAIKEKMNYFIKEYDVNINKAMTDQDKILAIVKLVRPLELLHPFYDGNARTFGFLLCNKLLMQQGLGPAIMNPNKMEGHSCKEFAILIEKGIELAKQVRDEAIVAAALVVSKKSS